MAVQLATPLLLLSADIRAIGRRAGRLLPSFLLGTVGTTLGALCGARLFGVPLAAAFGADGMRACAALAAKNIGGGLNFVAVAAAFISGGRSTLSHLCRRGSRCGSVEKHLSTDVGTGVGAGVVIATTAANTATVTISGFIQSSGLGF